VVFSIDTLEFKRAANNVRRDIIEMIYRAGSGHPGPSLSCVEIILAIYQDFLRFDPHNPTFPDRDRFILSKGHAAPTLYSILSRFYPHIERDEIMKTFRSGHLAEDGKTYVNTRFQGHPDMNLLPGVEFSSGSLGNGLGFACSAGESLRLRYSREHPGQPTPWVYCLIGDGEMDEGSTKEAISYAGAKNVNNLILVIDNNRQQLSGKKENVLNFGAVRDQFNKKQWSIIDQYREGEDLNGHDLQHLRFAFEKAREPGPHPRVIIAYTLKGKGVSFMEDDAAYHGDPPKPDEYEVCTKIFDITERILTNRLKVLQKPLNMVDTEQFFLNESLVSPREAYGRALYHLGKSDERIIRLDADLRNSLKGDYFYAYFPDRCFEAGIAESTMNLLACGFALDGKIPYVNTFSIFYLKAMEVIRNVIAYNKLNVKMIASHGDPRLVDGGSHAEIEILGALRSIPNLRVIQPSDAIMTYRLTGLMARELGPIYMRFGRDKLPLIYDGRTNPDFGRPIDNPFEIAPQLGQGHLLKDGEHLTIFALGDMVYQALLASKLLEEEGIFPTVIDMYSLKPIDRRLIIDHADKPILTVEPHNVIGGLGSAVSEVITTDRPQFVDRIGINDHFTKSGNPKDLNKAYGLDAAHIADRAKLLLKKIG
jgi:transketolase